MRSGGTLPESRLPSLLWLAAGSLLLVCLSVLTFIPALSGRLIWDDLSLLSQQTVNDGLEGLAQIWFVPSSLRTEEHYWPMAYTVFWLQRQLWGEFQNTFGFHLINVLLHAANSVLLWSLLMRLGFEWRAAWFSAALFSLHPVHVESVAWIIELKDVLSGFFYLLAINAFMSFVRKGDILAYGLSLACFFAAILSKSVALTLPAALLIFFWWRDGQVSVKQLAQVGPFIALAVIVAIFDFRIASKAGTADFALPFVDRIAIAGKAIWFYAWKIIWPYPLLSIYPRWPLPMNHMEGCLLLVAAFALVAILWLKSKTLGRGPAAAVLFYLVTLSPTLGLIRFSFMQHSFVADRFQYLASIGPLVLFGVSIMTLLKKFNGLKVDGPVCAVLLVVLSAMTWNQASLYQDASKLFSYTVEHNPDAWLAHMTLGIEEQRQGRLNNSISEFRKALNIKPQDAEMHRNLAVVLFQDGQTSEARVQIETALSIRPDYPAAIQLRETLANSTTTVTTH